MYPEQPDENRECIVMPLFEVVAYPKSRAKFLADKVTGEILLNDMKNAESVYAIGLTVKSGTKPSDLTEDKLYRTGNLLRIGFVQPADEGYLVIAKAVQRVESVSLTRKDGIFYAAFEPVMDLPDLDEDVQMEMLANVKKSIHEISSRFQSSEQFMRPIEKMNSIDQIMGFVMPYIPIKLEEKQALLEIVSVRERYLAFLEILMKQKENIKIQMEMAKKVSEKVNKSHREAMLREQLKIIQEELNETDDSAGEGGYRGRIEKSTMPEEVKKKALSELKKLETGGPHNPESSVIRNYLDLMLDLPWVTEEKKNIDIDEARRVLESNHNGLEKVKERIIQHLAVMKLKKEKQGSILLLTGPPGTGKTSLGKSIADALGREYVRISLGGVRDEAEIRGHRRTYIGALPGRIIQGMRKAGTKNPVFILDEVDKLSTSYAGDPASALLEVLDPEQNNTFSDHYLEVPYDLSEVFFIATANSLASIPWPLLDRMETIEISGYTKNEKLAIAKDHLLPCILEEHGLDADKLKIEDEALKGIIDKYTREAGVRGLKKQLARTARFVSEKIVSGKTDLPYVVRADMLKEVLGKEIIRQEEARKENVPGVVTGLAWTPVGGDILFIEGTFMPGNGKLTLTGQLGDVMKESAQISLSLVRSRLASTENSFNFTASDVHIHVPSGATPKDGPSAGVTLFTALTSLITGKAVDPKLAMTGEITLSGSVLPVGGIKEKVLAAHRAGIKKVILPKENERDLEDVPEDVRNELRFVPVETIEEVLKEALGIDLPGQVLSSSFSGNSFAATQNV
ncbi:ATP-dependent protease La Type I [Methanosarcina siciliae C2J]|uniref:Lon protease n=3 Tax=Methanosarcina siciliae TaxID=38027 RepID=A0A0E3PCA5_9EURY|nr:endopeptidase La [Methanosarcina siciliae]AKB28045.1 ATP-dependent protease La Type I [Methanosarcina siciliae T4/M]AKB31962.1 ATP-dependent protease La Type I [Methanosarcina siciliae HI350]AKB36263.1 ATP-dependent protease La Type I [Methanosarcina siciliae C2J]